jgi:pyroglutamyl-peptidase
VTSQRPTVLITGFGAFPGVAANATETLVPQLATAARARFPDYEIVDAVLPVDWKRAPELLQSLLDANAPSVALHFGVSHRAEDFRLERLSRNVCEPRHDACGALPEDVAVLRSGSDTLPATLPIDRIVARLKEIDVPCCTSDDAGAYLCNALLYRSLAAAHTRSTPHVAGFVHIPAALAVGGCDPAEAAECLLSWPMAVAGGLEIIAACLEDAAA